ncbi:efflux RND transporter permease subunit [Fulvivirgaceae bacterium LMO-SS25]
MDLNKKKVIKDFGLTTLAIDNRITVFVLTILIVIVGLTAYMNLPKENFPEVSQPTVYIGTSYPGNSPADMENLVTRPIEKEINSITGVDVIRSTSVQDFSSIVVEFVTDTDVTDALQKVKDAVDKAKSELPTDLPADPNVFELDFSEFPILNINLSGGDYSLEQLNEYAEDLEEEIEKLQEISKVEIRGVDEKEVKIHADPFKMDARMVSFSDIETAIGNENVTISGGNILAGNIRRSIRVVGEFTDPQQMEEIVVKREEGDVVYLKDVATVEFDYKEKQNYARLASQPVVMLDVVKRSGENLIEATEKIFNIIEVAKENVLPADLEITITNDQSEQTRMMVSSLENNIISGIILVTLILLFFLGTRNALFVGVAIPLSMFTTFLILGALGITINMMVLFALIMALGMLVDNGIVVVENVYRLMEEQGLSAYQATKQGVGEVALPIISSTATTLAAFLPLAMWPGIIGQFMKYLPITLIIALGSSLFVALVINPVLIATFMKVDKQGNTHHRKMWIRVIITAIVGALFIFFEIYWVGNLLILIAILFPINVYLLMPLMNVFNDRLIPSIERIYLRTLEYALKGIKPYLFFFGTVVMLIFSIGLMAVFTPNVLFFPENEPAYVNVFIEYPVGTDIETTNALALEMEEKVVEVIEPYRAIVKSVVSNVGQGTSDPADMSSVGQGETPHKARITVNFVEFKDRLDLSTSAIMSEIRESLDNYPGVTVTVDKNSDGPPTGKPINIEISGEEFETIVALTDRLRNTINSSGISGIERLRSDLETGKPELLLNIDRESARRFGLSSAMVANEIRTALFGKEISKYKQGEDEYEVYLRLQDEYRYDPDVLLNKNITYRDNNGTMVQVPISSVATAELSSSLGSIRRIDLKRVVTLSSNVLDGYNATVINDQIKDLLIDFPIPAGYTISFTGEQEKQAEEMAFLSNALMIAVFLIFMIIVSQFNKITAPFIIMTSVLFSTIGVFIGLVVFQMDFIVIMTMIGIISLAGIVVNNAIVLIDFIELSRKRRRNELGIKNGVLPYDEILSSIILAGKTRLRPVLLTAITTILGLIPLAIGLNIDFIKFFTEYDADFYMGGDNVLFWGPMSWTIVFGLSFATFLTLVIVPVMYLITDKINYKLAARKSSRQAKAGG